MKRYVLTLGVLLFAAVASRPALADTFFFYGSNDSSQVPCSAVTPCGEMMITTSGSTATITVSSLLTGYVFDKIGFNFSNGTDTLSLKSASGEIGATDALQGPGSFQEDGWGSFSYNFNTGENGGSNGSDCVVTAGSPGPGCTFTFIVQDSNAAAVLMASEFESSSSGGSGSGDFAGHLASNSKSGFEGEPFLQGTAPVPEPSSLMLLGTGALAAAGLIRRRFGH